MAKRRKIDITFGADRFSGESKGSGYEAIEEVLAKLKDQPTANVYLYHETGRTFHPKVYLFSNTSTQRALVFIGSANWSVGGFGQNVEASVLVRLNLDDQQHKACFDKIRSHFDQHWTGAMTDFVKRVTLDSLPTFMPLLNAAATGDQDDGSGDDVNPTRQSAPPDPDLQYAEAQFSGQRQRVKFGFTKPVRRRQPARPPANPPVPPAPIAPAAPVIPPPITYQLLWQSTPLTRRDLGIPDGASTKAAGSINLDKGLGTPTNFQHYFRDDALAALNWTPAGPTVDEAYAKIVLEVQGTNYGEFDVRIGHTTSTTTNTYTQGNAMTRLSWGPMKQHVANPTLIDKTLSLYRDMADPTRFKIEIA